MAQEQNMIFEHSPNGIDWTAVILPAGTTEYTLSGLTAGTARYGRWKAKGNGSTTSDSDYSPVVSTTTEAPPGTPLPAPTLTASPSISSPYALRFNWNNITGNNGYQGQYSTDNVTWQEAATVGAGVITLLTVPLAPGTLYYTRIRALGPDSSTNSDWSQAVTVRTDKFMEQFETFDTLDTWQVSNPDPTRVSIGVNAGLLEVKALGTGTTANYFANNVRKKTGFSGYPFSMEAHFGVGSEAVIHALGWDIGGAAGSVFYVKRGSVSNLGAFSIVVTNAGTLLHEQDYVSAHWTACNGLQIVSAAANDHKVYARKNVGNTWILVAAFSFTIADGEKKPVYMIQGGSAGTVKTLSSDYVRIY